jgi:hypothetical protein
LEAGISHSGPPTVAGVAGKTYSINSAIDAFTDARYAGIKAVADHRELNTEVHNFFQRFCGVNLTKNQVTKILGHEM